MAWIPLNPLQTNYLRRSFFHTSIADIYRAIGGKCLTGSFTLTLCSIDAIAQIYNMQISSDEQEESRCSSCNQLQPATFCITCHEGLYQPKLGRIFRRWIKDWLKPQCRYTDAHYLYEVRCGLVHAHGSQPAAPVSFSLSHGAHELHWNGLLSALSPNKAFILNLDSLLAEYTLAAKRSFDFWENDWQTNPQRMVANMNRMIATFRGPFVEEPPATLSEMHSSLAALDGAQEPSLEQLRQAICLMY